MRLCWTLAFVGMAAGCGGMQPGAVGSGDDGDGAEATTDGGVRGVPDGYVSTGCFSVEDCDDGDPCTIDQCSSSNTCSYAPADCHALDNDCEVGVCDSSIGDCVAKPANDGKDCTDGNDNPGLCTQGYCQKIPQCEVDYASYTCSDGSIDYNTTIGGTAAIDSYSCAGATGLTGPEYAMPFYVSTDRTVTLTLKDATGDLDLLVLEGTQCVASAACTAASITAGTSNETVTFDAKAFQDYMIVVDGKDAAGSDFTVAIDCPSGAVSGTCVSIQELSCNMTVAGTTGGAGSTNVLGGYDCNPNAPGPEDSYKLKRTSADYTVKLTGLSSDLDMVVLYSDDNEEFCDPTFCFDSAVQSGTTEEAVEVSTAGGLQYWVVIDSKTTTGGSYQLEVSCPVSCYNSSNTISCSSPTDSRSNNDSSRSQNLANDWACAPGETGPEVVYRFKPSATGAYTFTLSGTTADLDLIVVTGDASTCDPATACVNSTVAGGAYQGITAGTGEETVTFQADASQYYWIAVEGKNGAVSPYTLKMTSPVCPGPSCYNSANTLDCNYREETRSSDDTSRSKKSVDKWTCDPSTTGSEVVYKLAPATTGLYTVTLDGLSQDLDLVVVSGTSSSCDSASACVAQSVTTGSGSESVTFSADKGKYYYIAVDGQAGASSPYHIKLDSPACGAPTCKAGGSALSCSSPSVSARNDASGATADVNSWACDSGTSGPELGHTFTPSKSGPVTVEMIGLKADLDLIVLEAGTGSSCSPTAACVGVSANSGTTSEKVTFTADSTKKYLLMVDGKDGAISPYTLAITDGC